jgi:hypothetical protein
VNGQELILRASQYDGVELTLLGGALTAKGTRRTLAELGEQKSAERYCNDAEVGVPADEVDTTRCLPAAIGGCRHAARDRHPSCQVGGFDLFVLLQFIRQSALQKTGLLGFYCVRWTRTVWRRTYLFVPSLPVAVDPTSIELRLVDSGGDQINYQFCTYG